MELVKINQMKRILFMNNKIFKGAMGKAYGLAKLSSQSSEFIINKIEKFLVNNDFNQNYYGIIRDSLNHIEYYCEDCNDLLLSEVNTLEDFALVQSKNNAVKNE